jgi:hypothetical protein
MTESLNANLSWYVVYLILERIYAFLDLEVQYDPITLTKSHNIRMSNVSPQLGDLVQLFSFTKETFSPRESFHIIIFINELINSF